MPSVYRSSPATRSESGGGAPGSGGGISGGGDIYNRLLFIGCTGSLFFCFFSFFRQSHPAQLSLAQSSAAHRSAVRCRAVPRAAVRCRAVLLLCFYFLHTRYSYESTEYQGTYLVRAYTYVELKKNAHPTQLSSASSAAQSSAVRCRTLPYPAVRCCAVLCRAVPCCDVLCRAVLCFLCRIYQKKYDVRLCMRRPGCFPGAWSSWHMQVACLCLKYWVIHSTTSVVPFLTSL